MFDIKPTSIQSGSEWKQSQRCYYALVTWWKYFSTFEDVRWCHVESRFGSMFFAFIMIFCRFFIWILSASWSHVLQGMLKFGFFSASAKSGKPTYNLYFVKKLFPFFMVTIEVWSTVYSSTDTELLSELLLPGKISLRRHLMNLLISPFLCCIVFWRAGLIFNQGASALEPLQHQGHVTTVRLDLVMVLSFMVCKMKSLMPGLHCWLKSCCTSQLCMDFSLRDAKFCMDEGEK